MATTQDQTSEMAYDKSTNSITSCDQLKSTYVKLRHEHKQITNKILRFKYDNEKTLSELQNMIHVMSQTLINTCSRKRKFEETDFVNISTGDLLSFNEVSRISDGGGGGDDDEDYIAILSELAEKTEAEKSCASGRSCKRIIPFLHKLYDMVEKQEIDYLVSWELPRRDSFIVWDINKFATHVLPMYFKHSNFSSFNSQLNLYGFKKVSWERYEYANEWFVGGKYELLANIKKRNKLPTFGTISSSSQVEMFINRLRTIQEYHEKKIIWLSKYEQQIKSSMQELKEMVVNITNFVNKVMLKSSQKLENVKAQKLDLEENVVDNENGQHSGINNISESRDESLFEELGIDQQALEKAIEMEDGLSKMDNYLDVCLGKSLEIE